MFNISYNILCEEISKQACNPKKYSWIKWIIISVKYIKCKKSEWYEFARW